MSSSASSSPLRSVPLAALGAVAALAAVLFVKPAPKPPAKVAATGAVSAAVVAPTTDALAPLLVPHPGDRREDEDIRKAQERVRQGRSRTAALERLGWAFVSKARASRVETFYLMAGRCAAVLQTEDAKSPEGLLLRGHVLHSLHRFKEAEAVARELIADRGQPVEYGLLADTLMDQGRLAEAVEACQKMLDQRPSPEAYARAAHLRWLKGDTAGAIELMEMATAALGPDTRSEGAAWLLIRLGFHRFQEGRTDAALGVCAEVLRQRSDYAPALLLQGRAFLSQGQTGAAIEALRAAADRDPLPECLWLLAEALREGGRPQEAAEVEARLLRDAAATDARTFSLFLATRGHSPEKAVQLAESELAVRGDVFTHDALAWALASAGRFEDALPRMRQALAEGTQDARLFFHAAVIAARCGRDDEAREWAARAAAMSHQLLPSERMQLANATQRGPTSPDATGSRLSTARD